MLFRISPALLILTLALPSLEAEPTHPRRAWSIGINDHDELPDLKNAGNDANLVAKLLASHTYLAKSSTDTGLAEMRTVLEEMRGQTQNEVTLFYFAGHGVELHGQNYLLPADFSATETATEEILVKQAIPLRDVLEAMRDIEGIKVIVLDCCRNNPFASGPAGLARVHESEIPDKTLLIFSGAPGTTVSDGTGNHSPFTEQFCAKAVPGLPAMDLAVLIQEELSTQKPWVAFNGAAASLKVLMETPLLPGRRVSPLEAKGVQEIEFGDKSTVRGFLARIKTYDREGKAVFPFFLTTEKKLIVSPAPDFDPGSTGELLDGLEVRIVGEDEDALESFNGKMIEIEDAHVSSGLEWYCHPIGFFIESPAGIRVLPKASP